MGRSPCCSSTGLNRGSWTASEDKILSDYIKLHGEGKWREHPVKAGLKRCGKSCRLRWLNYLKPDIKRGNISCDEEDLIIRLHKLLGNRWSLIAGRLPGRTDNEIKNYWNTTLAKKVHENENFQEENPKKMKINKECVNEIRTKAMRCSRTHFSPHPQQMEPPRSNVVENIQDPGNPNTCRLIETADDAFMFYNHENNNNESSFMGVGVNMGGSGNLSGFFNVEFSDPFNLINDQMVKGDDDHTVCSTPTQGFSKEIMEHFTSIGGK
ncbi:hypothetical protein SSX86_004095 [Deinandra increscens subsp. villosa]|uniref:Myb-related protein 123 n=1 Tax=Deinandra increscens subsp. villosa TaxID=3103831 RepID=A0AAP0H8I8_9ASTR